MLCWCAILICTPASGDEAFGPRWKHTTADVKLDANTKEAITDFGFASQSNMEILNVNGDCGCIVVVPFKQLYKPGEMGSIRVKVINRGNTGKRSHKIMVTLSDSKKPQVLTLSVENNTPILVDKRRYVWTEPDEVQEFNVITELQGPMKGKMDFEGRKNFAFYLEGIEPDHKDLRSRTFKVTVWMKTDIQNSVGIFSLNLTEAELNYSENIGIP